MKTYKAGKKLALAGALFGALTPAALGQGLQMYSKGGKTCDTFQSSNGKEITTCTSYKGNIEIGRQSTDGKLTRVSFRFPDGKHYIFVALPGNLYKGLPEGLRTDYLNSDSPSGKEEQAEHDKMVKEVILPENRLPTAEELSAQDEEFLNMLKKEYEEFRKKRNY